MTEVSIDMNMKSGKGKATVGDIEYDVSTPLGLLDMVIGQLESIIENKETGNLAYTQRDLDAYKYIKAFGSNKAAGLFFKTKQKAVRDGNRFQDNFAVINHLKNRGLWEEDA